MMADLPRYAFSLALGALAMSSVALGQDDNGPTSAPTEEPLGWTLPLSTDDSSDVLSELDRLSLSASGTGFAASAYDSRADNPLEPVAVTLRALDKITATYRDLEIPIGEEVSFGTLTLLPQTCDKRPPEETPETTVFLEVFATTDDVQGARTRAARGESDLPALGTIRLAGEEQTSAERSALFRGWMFASSPSLNALEHPVYDVWVIDCTMVDPRI